MDVVLVYGDKLKDFGSEDRGPDQVFSGIPQRSSLVQKVTLYIDSFYRYAKMPLPRDTPVSVDTANIYGTQVFDSLKFVYDVFDVHWAFPIRDDASVYFPGINAYPDITVFFSIPTMGDDHGDVDGSIISSSNIRSISWSIRLLFDTGMGYGF